MWNRAELKARGKEAFRANYWECVVVALIFALLIGGGAAAGRDKVHDASDTNGVSVELTEDLGSMPRGMVGIFAGALVGISAVASFVKLLVVNPLKVGCKRFFVANSEEPAQLGELLYGFRNGYGNVVVAMLLRDLFTFLWGLLLIVPAFIKAYSYRMVPYILADNPDISGREAITLSRQMMNGHKWNTFVLDLSFIGWYLLAILTADIVGVLWTNPYVEATDAELYKAIRDL